MNNDVRKHISKLPRLKLDGSDGDKEKAEFLEAAFPRGYILFSPKNPSESMEVPGKWEEVSKVWQRVE